jgi:hypothetical protein
MEEYSTKLLKLAKETVSIVRTSTLKDNEIKMIINAAIIDMKRVGIDVEKNKDDDLIILTIMTFVKANFGDTDPNKKKSYMQQYLNNLNNIKLTCKYLIQESGDSNA